MSDPYPRFEVGNTKQFTVTYSSAPGTTPHFTIYSNSGFADVVHSVTATASSTTAFFAVFTVPDSVQLLHCWEFIASYTLGPVLNRGVFCPVKSNVH